MTETAAQGKNWFVEGSSVFDANVEFLVDGRAYARRWRELAEETRHEGGDVIHSAWRLSNVVIDPTPQLTRPTLLRTLQAEQGYGGRSFVRLSGHGFTLMNLPTFLRLKLANRQGSAKIYPYIDSHFASQVGSYHEKSTTFISSSSAARLMLGSIDMTDRRMDEPEHTTKTSAAKRPSHDVGIVIHGPAAVEHALRELDLWVLSTYYRNRILWPYRPSRHASPESRRTDIANARTKANPPETAETCRLQLLRTRSRPTRERSWMFSFESDQTLRSAYMSALGQAEQYIYIEDQYFTPNFGNAAYGSWHWFDGESPMRALKDAISRGVRLFVLLPGTKPNGPGISEMRSSAIEGLETFARRNGHARPMFLQRYSAPRRRRGSPTEVHVHSKLLICDDDYAIIGSQNLNARSFINDVELAAGIQGSCIADLRRRLWREHAGFALPPDYGDALDRIAARCVDVEFETRGRFQLRPYVVAPRPYPPGRLKRLVWRVSETHRGQ